MLPGGLSDCLMFSCSLMASGLPERVFLQTRPRRPWHAAGVNPADGPTDADLTALLDAERGAQAARERSQERWLRQAALEEARLTGVLLDAAEQHLAVNVSTVSGRRHSGRITMVAQDCCGVLTTAGTQAYLRTAAITVVQHDRLLRPVPAAADRRAPVETRFADLLADLTEERPVVAFFSAGAIDAVVGRLLAVGVDVATVEIDERRSVAYVALESVTEASFLPSG